MRCEEVREHLALNTQEPELCASIAEHVADCEACRRTGLLFSRIDATLKAAPGWNPPQDFAQRIAAHAVPAQLSVAVPRSSQKVWGAVAMGALTAAAIWAVGRATTTHDQWGTDLSRMLVANAVTVAWASMGVALGVAAWFTRRALS